MAIIKNGVRIFMFGVFFLIAFPAAGVFSESCQQETKWSFTFDGSSVSEALEQIAAATNRKIILKGNTDSRVNRDYTHQAVEDIIRDILRDDNHVLIRVPNKEGMDTIEIMLLGRASGKMESYHSEVSLIQSESGNPADKGKPAEFPRKENSSKTHSVTRKTSGSDIPPEPDMNKWKGLEPPPSPPGLPVPGK